MKRSTCTILLVLSLATAALAQTTLPAQSAAPAIDLASLRAEALAHLNKGEFQTGATMLSEVLRQAPTDTLSVQANQWVSGYMERRVQGEKQRQSEFDASESKARDMLVIASAGQDAIDTLKPLRKPASAARTAVADLLNAPLDAANATSDDWYLTRLDEDSAKVLALAQLTDETIPGLTPECAAVVSAAVERVRTAIADFDQLARQQDWSAGNGDKSLDAIRLQADALAMAVEHLSSMTSGSPWRVAIDRVRIAREVSLNKSEFLANAWVTEIITGAEAHAERLTQEQSWTKAMGLYNALSDLFDNRNEQYKDRIRVIGRHARVLALYGPVTPNGADASEDGFYSEDPEQPDSAPAAQPDDSPAKWKQRIAGVDGRMVRSAISQMEESYVDNIDYRKVLLSALEAVLVLAETPELSETFPGLANDTARGEFTRRINAMMAEANEKDLVRHLDVAMAFNRVGTANRRTVGLPDEVIDVEFTDGMLTPLDPFSSMIWPDEWQDFKKHTMGSFFGVGIQISQENGMLKVVSPMEDTPAYRAGVLAGDFIVAIDGQPAQNIAVDEAVKRITGPKGTKVVLTIKRAGRDEPFDISLIRDEIHVQTVKGWKRINGDRWDWMLDPENRIGYIRVTSFTRDTTRELRAALAELQKQGARGLVLDLRFNPGGLLPEATSVADEFLNRGRIVSTKGRQQPRMDAEATSAGTFLNGEMVVLVNDYSASAAEIVSGALKDLNRAVVVGTRSYGKGSVQNLIPIRPDQAYLKLTTAYYYLPQGRCLHRTDSSATWGVDPDITVPITPEQMKRWLELRRRTEIIQERNVHEFEKQMQEQFQADVQLDTALLLLRLSLLGEKV